MGGSGSKGTTNTTNNIPPELSGLTAKTAGFIGNIQDSPGFNPAEYGTAHPQAVPGLSANQQQAVGAAFGVGDATYGEANAYGSLQNAS